MQLLPQGTAPRNGLDDYSTERVYLTMGHDVSEAMRLFDSLTAERQEDAIRLMKLLQVDQEAAIRYVEHITGVRWEDITGCSPVFCF